MQISNQVSFYLPETVKENLPYVSFLHRIIGKVIEGLLNAMLRMQENVDQGRLQISVVDGSGRPVRNARLRISYTAEPDRVLDEETTDDSGKTEELVLGAPPLEYSMSPVEQQPYSEYTVSVEADGFENEEVAGIEILPDVLAMQEFRLKLKEETAPEFERIVIGPHTLFGNYPPKQPEAEIKPVNESGEIVLSRVVIPEYIIVHDGPVSDRAAQNYYVRYRDYIKNVASSEIYATWPDDTIRANVLAIMSFTLNRVYTEWYRNQH